MYDRASSRDTNRNEVQHSMMIKNTVRLQPIFFRVPLCVMEWSGLQAIGFSVADERVLSPLGPRLYKSTAPSCAGTAHELDLTSIVLLG
jgi:hypothetical protein